MTPLARPGCALAARITAALVLVTAATLKAFSPAEAALLSEAYGVPVWVSVASVLVELAVATLLVVGPYRRGTHLVACLLFALFALFSLYRAAAGYESCGCFGSVRVNPWVTATLDLLLGGWLAASWSAPAPQRLGSLRMAGLGFLLLAAPLGSRLALAAPQGLAADNALPATGLVLLDPEEWIGGPFPLTGVLEGDSPAGRGAWRILIYHHDCPECQAAAPKYEALRREHPGVLLIETPPFAPTGPQGRGQAGHAWLPDDRDWFVQAPVEVRVVDGVVTHASRDLPSLREPPLKPL